jgi:hypothetical protein
MRTGHGCEHDPCDECEASRQPLDRRGRDQGLARVLPRVSGRRNQRGHAMHGLS